MIIIRNGQHTARVLRHLREQAGLTRKQLSQRIYISDRTIANREYGQRSLDTDALIDTARALGHAVALLPAEQPDLRSVVRYAEGLGYDLALIPREDA